MSIFIPLFVIAIIFSFAINYYRVIFLRRHLMFMKVEAFIARNDTSDRMLYIVNEAFKDAVSISLPINMYLSNRSFEKLPKAEQNKLHDKEIEDHELAANEMEEIIMLMFKINRKLTFPIHFILYIISFISNRNKIKENEIEYINTSNFKHQC